MEHKTEANINMRSFSLSKPLGAELLAFFQSSVLFYIAGKKKSPEYRLWNYCDCNIPALLFDGGSRGIRRLLKISEFFSLPS